MVIFQNYLYIPLIDYPTPKNHELPNPSFTVIISERERLDVGPSLGIREHSEIWVGDDDCNIYRLHIGSCEGILHDHLLFPCHSYDGSKICGYGLLRAHKKFAHPSIDIFNLGAPSLLDYDISSAWTSTPKQYRIDLTLMYPPGFVIANPLIIHDPAPASVTEATWDQYISGERARQFAHGTAQFHTPTLHEEQNISQSRVHPLYSIAMVIKDHLTHTTQIVQNCFTSRET